MVKVKIGDSEYEVTSTPIYLTVEKTYSKEVFIFYVNGKEYKGYISKAGKLVVNSPQQ